jgi:hypothetical protein
VDVTTVNYTGAIEQAAGWAFNLVGQLARVVLDFFFLRCLPSLLVLFNFGAILQ